MGGPKLPEQERADAILAAAYRIALTEGLDAVTARRVATAAGISPGLVFFHFQSKDGLLQALLDVLLNGTLDALTHPSLSALAPWDRLERMIRVELDRLVEYHAGVELLFAFYFSRPDDLFRTRIEASFGRYLEAFLPVCQEVAGPGGVSGASTGVGGVSGDDLASTVVALIHGASIQAIRNPASVYPDALLATVLALRPRPAERP
ncbi:TetR/AcrR family transcriptional regulator [Cryobacterium lactosi]|uniref:TetR/AcrR family transcriptional regulator n=1 Tax=Cryobacterium lactosi TaxID=1259202 RepID=A0A4R9BP83_9MICO|nr:TetR/AcrR family transcriptional regulator [Cryobacterium lactosi]TFD87205.1 TetR/AcrR family transcriptional regulator [Cryobacterium lactosi]